MQERFNIQANIKNPQRLRDVYGNIGVEVISPTLLRGA